jgi:predicted MPP superfamily phosphohydrolase
MTRRRRWLLAATVAAGVTIDAWWLEPRVLLTREDVALPVGTSRLRLAHLADLHVDAMTPQLHRLVAEVTAAAPDAILVSGDVIADTKDEDLARRRATVAAGLFAELRRVAPVYAVQGHSDYLGQVVATVAGGGVEWLHDDGRLLTRLLAPRAADPTAVPGASILLLGLGQQLGWDQQVPVAEPGFAPRRLADGWAMAREAGGKRRNDYLAWDPWPGQPGLADDGGPLAWREVELSCQVWIDAPATAVGVVVASRSVLGEDRLIRFARAAAHPTDDGTFALVFAGSAATAGAAGAAGAVDSGVAPEPGRWTHLRVRLTQAADRLRVEARAWSAGAPEPAVWQAWAEDSSPTRVTAGTVALWGWGDGVAAWRNLEARAGDGSLLLAEPFDQAVTPPGWRDRPRASRLALALAKSPRDATALPRVVLAHSPDAVLEAAAAGVDVVLAGHTHGGQVRIPYFGALITRTFIGRRYDRGLFAFAGARPDGPTWLYVNAGVGTSFLPVRFADPPTWAMIDLVPGAPSPQR